MEEFSKAYLRDCQRLAMSLIIKSNSAIECMNKHIRMVYGEQYANDNEPQTYRYNMHVCGEYHPTDTMMRVVSLDTLQEIDFTKANLDIHKKTQKAYRVGTDAMNELMDKYPENYSLILGIIYPAQMDEVLNAKDGQIVAYDKELVESQELSLIRDLNEFCVGQHLRWHVPAHVYGHDLYPAAFYSVFYSALLPKILNLRSARCKTYEAHTFHIRMYLASHYELDRYMRFMDMYQILFLYRNILYLERNSGKSEQFDLLLDKLLTRRNIPLSELNVRHLSDFSNDHSPKLIVRKKNLNPIHNASDIDYLSMDNLKDVESDTAPGNGLWWKDHFASTEKLFKRASSSITQTKDLYSSMYDYSDAVPHPLEMVLLRQWICWSYSGRYNSTVVFRNPRTAQRHSLRAWDAFIYMYIIGLNYIGLKPLSIANIMNYHELRIDLPDIYELAQKTNYENIDLLDYCEHSLLQLPAIGSSIVSNEVFFEKSHAIYREGVRQWLQVSNEHSMDRKAMLENMFHSFYRDRSYNVPPFMISEWLFGKNLPQLDFTEKEALDIMTDIYRQATGYVPDDDKQIGNIQRALIQVFRKLSSYTVQFIGEINDSKIINLSWGALRIEPNDRMLLSDGHQTDTKIEIEQSHGKLVQSVSSSDIPIDVFSHQETLIFQDELNIESDLKQNASSMQHINIYIPSFSLELLSQQSL